MHLADAFIQSDFCIQVIHFFTFIKSIIIINLMYEVHGSPFKS